MQRREFVRSVLGGFAGLSMGGPWAAAQSRVQPDLAGLAEANKLQVFNRTAAALHEGDRHGVRLNGQPGDGVAYVPGSSFANGTIECDIRGKDLPQQSFVGIAFHGVDGRTLDAIYFRPFNFKAQDPVGRSHAVQYVSHPLNTWDKLRQTQPGKYEQPVNPVPDPNDWFHARVVIAAPKISVYVADAKEPCLVVDALSDRRSGLVGLWVGNNSAGDFANLKILGG
jgi:hypothetical protein